MFSYVGCWLNLLDLFVVKMKYRNLNTTIPRLASSLPGDTYQKHPANSTMSAFSITPELTSDNKSELQAVIISCGDDALMYPLTSAPELPKSLLPVGGVPLIWYQLSLLRQAGFDSVLICVETPFRETISQSVETFRKRTSHLGTFTITLRSVEEQIGTADALRSVHKLITNDFIVLSGDMIVDDIVEQLANIHHLNNATVSMVLLDTKTRRKGIDGVNYVALVR